MRIRTRTPIVFVGAGRFSDPQYLSPAILLSDLSQAWNEQNRGRTSKQRLECIDQLKERHKRVELPSTFKIEAQWGRETAAGLRAMGGKEGCWKDEGAKRGVGSMKGSARRAKGHGSSGKGVVGAGEGCSGNGRGG
ncbi:hypothetical protein ACH5RR_031014 [Cinchona calisaya]|uniref:Cell division control protein 24 OB domain-containing protein n=1 Tax=Cinchona calisaya TaxID=153742 RepID=A0ABD2YDZ5_9GENT